MFAAGKDASYPEDTYVLERIVEIEPVGTDSAKIVWEWKLFDHLIQEFDSSKPNFGSVANNPQLLDMNYDAGFGSNPIHANAIDYNADLDQIAISSRHLSEVFIIDHSTTTSEAASHSNGIYGRGGDFLWRWGNPEVYGKGTILDKKLGRQHDIKWITDGLYKGMMSVFSNDSFGNDSSASSIHIIDQNETNGVYKLSSGKFLPNDYFWSYAGTILGEVMSEDSRCGVQIMSNGNALINETEKGKISEINTSGELVWVYKIPTADNSTFDQFAIPKGTGSFRANRYPESYAAFHDKTFRSMGIIEDTNAISEKCNDLLSVKNELISNLNAYPNPVNDVLNFDKNLDEIMVYNFLGKIISRKMNSDYIDLGDLAGGLYFIKTSVKNKSKIIKVLKK